MNKHSASRSRRASSRSRQRTLGFTLVEVLVTSVVMSVGLLGVAALQVASLRDNHASYIRGQATALADDIIDRIRANRDNAAQYTVTYTGTLATSTQAGLDVTQWKAALQSELPNSGGAMPTNANGMVVVTPVGPAALRHFSVEVRIAWGERGTANPIEFVTRTEV